MIPTHTALLNHASVLGVTCCHPMSGRYCATGRELWLEYRAECVATGRELWLEYRAECVATGGRAMMETVRHQTPEWADEIKIRALILTNGMGREAA